MLRVVIMAKGVCLCGDIVYIEDEHMIRVE